MGTKYQRRMDDETEVKNLFFGVALSNLVLNPFVILFGAALWLTGFVRARAVNHDNEEQVESTLFLTNAFLEIFSAIIAFTRWRISSIASFLSNRRFGE